MMKLKPIVRKYMKRLKEDGKAKSMACIRKPEDNEENDDGDDDDKDKDGGGGGGKG